MAVDRQAVVVIHGIGEQHPMSTLRSFVDGLGESKYYSKPDRLSESFELRRLTLPSTSKRPPTDFYELYWAHHFEDGRFLDTLRWALRLAFRRPFWRLNSTLRGPVCLVQVLTVVLLALLAWSFAASAQSQGVTAAWETWQGRLAVLVLIAQVVAGRFITGSLADAARYLTPHPRNIAARSAVRSEGLRLLRTLHEHGRYQRVAIVGHSLGGVIGLDLVRLAWDELRHPHIDHAGRQPQMKEFDESARALRDSPSRADVVAFQQAQSKLWRENRKRGVPWLVTDFVTLGTPLAHADLLLESKSVAFRKLQAEREYPRCPPVADEGGKSYYMEMVQEGDQKRTFRVGHHGAPFGPTRWTNIYFPVRGFWTGDPVGGPVARVFGPGVRDVPVRPSIDTWRSRILLGCHTLYWARKDDHEPSAGTERRARNEETGTKESLVMLRHALGLDTKLSALPYPPASPGPNA